MRAREVMGAGLMVTLAVFQADYHSTPRQPWPIQTLSSSMHLVSPRCSAGASPFFIMPGCSRCRCYTRAVQVTALPRAPKIM